MEIVREGEGERREKEICILVFCAFLLSPLLFFSLLSSLLLLSPFLCIRSPLIFSLLCLLFPLHSLSSLLFSCLVLSSLLFSTLLFSTLLLSSLLFPLLLTNPVSSRTEQIT